MVLSKITVLKRERYREKPGLFMGGQVSIETLAYLINPFLPFTVTEFLSRSHDHSED